MQTKRKKVIIAALTIVVVGLIAYWAWPKRDARAAMRKELLDNPSDDAFRRFGELPFDQRRELGRDMMGNRMRKLARDYAALPPDKKRDFLDKRIAEEDKWRKEREARGGQGGPGNWGGPGQGGPGGGQGNGGQGNGGQGNGGRGPGGRNMSPEQRSQWANTRLDHGDPAQRAQMAGFRGDMAARRAATGH